MSDALTLHNCGSQLGLSEQNTDRFVGVPFLCYQLNSNDLQVVALYRSTSPIVTASLVRVQCDCYLRDLLMQVMYSINVSKNRNFVFDQVIVGL